MHENICCIKRKETAVMWRILSHSLLLFFHDSTYRPFAGTCSHPTFADAGSARVLVMPVLMLNGSCSSALCSLLSSTTKASKGIRSRVKQEWVEAGSSNSFSARSWRRGKLRSEECGEGSFQCVEAAVLSALEEGLEP